jgi:hypothetical protein
MSMAFLLAEILLHCWRERLLDLIGMHGIAISCS